MHDGKASLALMPCNFCVHMTSHSSIPNVGFVRAHKGCLSSCQKEFMVAQSLIVVTVRKMNPELFKSYLSVCVLIMFGLKKGFRLSQRVILSNR